MADSVSEYMAARAPEQQAILQALRALALAAMPGVHEYVYQGVLSYGLTASPFERHCYLVPQAKGYVNLGFFFGAQLPDPEHLLQGEGARMRHVKVRSAAEATNPALRALVEAAWAAAPAAIAALHAARGHGLAKRSG
jgi:hypothetical protein